MVRKIRLQRKHFNFIFSTQFQQIAAREGVNYKNDGNQQKKNSKDRILIDLHVKPVLRA